MRHDDHRPTIPAHQPFDARLPFQVQVVVRLVEQEQVGRPHDQPRQPDQLRLPAAEHAHRLLERFLAQPQVTQRRTHPVLVGQPARRFVLVQETGVLVHHPRQPPFVRIHRRLAHLRLFERQRMPQPGYLRRAGQGRLEHRQTERAVPRGLCGLAGQGVRRDLLGQVARGQPPLLKNRAGVGLEQAEHELEHGGFAAAVGPHQADLLPGLDFPVQPRQNGGVEIGVMNVVQVDDNLSHCFCLAPHGAETKSRERKRPRPIVDVISKSLGALN